MEMETKKSDELAVVKAAAWAWYQHGSGSDGKPMREFDIARRSGRASTRPSRYKLEAMRNNDDHDNSLTTSPINTHDHEYDSLLLDSYEIKRISQRLNHVIEFSGIKVYDELLGIVQDIGDEENYHKNHCLSSDIGDCSSGGGRYSSSSRRKSKISNSHFLKGFLQRHAVICGRSQDVDDSAAVFRRRRRPEN